MSMSSKTKILTVVTFSAVALFSLAAFCMPPWKSCHVINDTTHLCEPKCGFWNCAGYKDGPCTKTTTTTN